MTATTIATAARPGRRLRRRHLWLVPGLAIAIVANQLGEANGVGILALIAFGIAPDLPRLFGVRGRPAHNILHQPLIAATVAGAMALGTAAALVPVVWLVGSLVWLGHVVAGWGVGDVPRPLTPGAATRG
ncbi:MAG TPA: hypothetical protein VFR93_02375 [Candidatus Limnocylindrales bacterium]|jgi:hypothetical protein|nr:hypothetical protein [Candidatus Limnocylindrales bacterium]